MIAGLKALLAGGTVVGQDELKVERALPHGHVAAALGMVRKIALDRLILSTARDEQSRRARSSATAPEESPGERLIVRCNPLLAEERARKRAELLAATERDLNRIQQAVARQRVPLRSQAKKAIQRNSNRQPIMAFAALMDYLGTLTRNVLAAPFQDSPSIILYVSPTPLQEAAFERLGLNPRRVH